MRYDNVLFFATIFEVTAINKKFSDSLIGFEISCGETSNSTSGVDPVFQMEPYTHDDLTWYLEVEREKPCLYINSSQLDFRRRIYNVNMLEKICLEMVRM